MMMALAFEWDLIFLLFAEEIGAPVDQIEQGKHQRERYPGDDVDALRAGTLSCGEPGPPGSAAVWPLGGLHVHFALP